MRIKGLNGDTAGVKANGTNATPSTAGHLVWDLRNISKQFPAVLANDDISLQLRSHKIHGLLGANGCGKSTLIGVLSGTVRPTHGTIIHDGNIIELASARQAKEAGIATVFQEFSLVPHLTVAENIFLGQALPKTRLGLIDYTALRARSRDVLSRLQLDDQFSVNDKIAHLSVAHQQLVEIAKAVSLGGHTLILDEPTAALSYSEVENLHQLLKRLRSEGTSILYVSHRLDEVIDIVDCATILRDGRVVSSAVDTKLTIEYIVSAMIGDMKTQERARLSNIQAEVALSVRRLQTNGIEHAEFDVHKGEIFGIAGVMGSGRTALLRSLFGAIALRQGSIYLNGQLFQPTSPHDSVKRGVAFVPENRKTDSLFFNFSSTSNITISALRIVSRMRWINRSRERTAFLEYQRSMRLPDAAHDAGPSQLSGGNQQKLVLARWLFAESSLFLLDEPTNGVDVGAKASIYELITAIAKKGRAIVLVSSDLKELLQWCDRIAILRSGQISQILPASLLDEESLTEAIATRSSTVVQNDLESR